MIIQNPQYKRIADLYLDNNSIPSVKELEGSEWFTTFRVLSLRGNSLKQVNFFKDFNFWKMFIRIGALSKENIMPFIYMLISKLPLNNSF